MPDATSGCRACPARPRGRSFFARQPVALIEPRQGRGGSGDAVFGETGAQLFEALVPLRFERRLDDRALRLDPSRPRIAALRPARRCERGNPRQANDQSPLS